jgi:hypothetical protein
MLLDFYFEFKFAVAVGTFGNALTEVLATLRKKPLTNAAIAEDANTSGNLAKEY